MTKRRTKYGIGFWIVKVIKSCKTEEQLRGARRLLHYFENSLKYDPPYELIKEIYIAYSEQQGLLYDQSQEKETKIQSITFDPDIHL